LNEGNEVGDIDGFVDGINVGDEEGLNVG